MPSHKKKLAAAEIMEHYADHDAHGYTQGWGRWGNGGTCKVYTSDGPKYVPDGDGDCSSGVNRAYNSAGIDTGGATWTGNMLDCMLASGNFRAHRMSDGYSCDDGYIAQRGDCYLAHHDGFQHTAMCISPNPDMLAEFYIAETGDIYGELGDQTGWECRRAPFYGGWDYVLECIDEGDDDNMRPNDVWEYNYNNSAPGGNCYNALMETTYAVAVPHDSVTSDGTNGSMKDRVDWIDMRVREMYPVIMAIADKLGVGLDKPKED